MPALRSRASRPKPRGRGAQSGMAKRRKQRQRAEQPDSEGRWEEILAAGATVFRRLGYAQATVADVALELGINRATLYYYVSDKAELLVRILEAPVQEMTRTLREIRDEDVAPEQKLRRAVAAHMHALEANYPTLFVFFAENLHMLPMRSDADIHKNAEGYGDLLTSIIADGMQRGAFRSDLDPRLMMLAVVGMMNWSHRWYEPGSAHSLSEIGDQFAELVLDGLRDR